MKVQGEKGGGVQYFPDRGDDGDGGGISYFRVSNATNAKRSTDNEIVKGEEK